MRIKYVVLALFAAFFVALTLPFHTNAIAQDISEVEKLANPDSKTFLPALVLVCLSIIIIIFLIVSCFVAHTTIKHNPNAAEFLNSFFTSSNALQILTVCSVVITAMFLALSDRLNEGVLALLSSVAGYVLGSLQSSNQSSLKAIQEQLENKKKESM